MLALLFAFSACGDPPASVTRTEFALGTFVSARIEGLSENKANTALDKAFARLHEIELIASAKRPDSELYHVNRNAFPDAVSVSDELYSLLHAGRFYADMTDGAFDITLGALVELWGIGTDDYRIPDEDEIAGVLECVGYEHLVLCEDARSVRFLRAGLRLDLGAIAKGHAANEMKRVLTENGVKSAILNLGGDVITIGDNDGRDWLIGIADPRDPRKPLAGQGDPVLHISDKAVVTSGDYERYFMHEDVRYHHIFDRATGYPADNGILGATVILECALIADVFSTAFFVMGMERALEFAASMPEMGYILIDSDVNYVISDNIVFRNIY
jgi:thiamine biosynthesis lipoprotein